MSSSSLPGSPSQRTLEESSLSEQVVPARSTGRLATPPVLCASSRSLSPASLPMAADSTRTTRYDAARGQPNELLYSQDDHVGPGLPARYEPVPSAVDGMGCPGDSVAASLGVMATLQDTPPVDSVFAGEWTPHLPTDDAAHGRVAVDSIDTPDAWTVSAGAPATATAADVAVVDAPPLGPPVAVTPIAAPDAGPARTADVPVIGASSFDASVIRGRVGAPASSTVPFVVPAAASTAEAATTDAPRLDFPMTGHPSSAPVVLTVPVRAPATVAGALTVDAGAPSSGSLDVFRGTDVATVRGDPPGASVATGHAATGVSGKPGPAAGARASSHGTTPSSAMDCVAFLMRATFRVRDERDQSIFPFLGVAYIVAKFGCLAGILDPVRQRVFDATIVDLFRSPASALTFMEKTFAVDRGGLNLGGRLTRNRHVSGQPTAFRSGDFNVFLNPDSRPTQWLSRSLSVRDGISLGRSGTSGAGGLSRAELDALSTRLQSHAVVNAASEVGCRVHYCRESSGTLVASEVVYTWAFPFSADSRCEQLLQSLRPALLRSPPQWMTQNANASRRRRLDGGRSAAPRSRQATILPAEGASSRSNQTSVPAPARSTARTLDAPALSSAVAPQRTATRFRDAQVEAIASTSAPTDGASSAGGARLAVANSLPVRTLPALSVESTELAVPTSGSRKRSAVEKRNSHARVKALKSSGSSMKGKKPASAEGSGASKTAPTGSRAALHATQMRSCDCTLAASSSGGGSWIVCEVRRSRDSAFLGMAVGVQLSWATDLMNGGRLDIGYSLRSVVPVGRSSSLQYVLNIDETRERSVTPSDTRTTVSQLPSVHADYTSLDFAAAVERLCGRALGVLPPSAPLLSASADDGAGDGTTEEPGAAGTLLTPARAGTVNPADRDPVNLCGTARGSVRAPSEATGDLRVVVVEAPADVSPLAVAITLRTPIALSHERAVSSRVPGRLVLFPVQVGPPVHAGRC